MRGQCVSDTVTYNTLVADVGQLTEFDERHDSFNDDRDCQTMRALQVCIVDVFKHTCWKVWKVTLVFADIFVCRVWLQQPLSELWAACDNSSPQPQQARLLSPSPMPPLQPPTNTLALCEHGRAREVACEARIAIHVLWKQTHLPR